MAGAIPTCSDQPVFSPLSIENLLSINPRLHYVGVHAERISREDQEIRIFADIERADSGFQPEHFSSSESQRAQCPLA